MCSECTVSFFVFLLGAGLTDGSKESDDDSLHYVYYIVIACGVFLLIMSLVTIVVCCKYVCLSNRFVCLLEVLVFF